MQMTRVDRPNLSQLPLPVLDLARNFHSNLSMSSLLEEHDMFWLVAFGLDGQSLVATLQTCSKVWCVFEFHLACAL